ncbi:spore germination protein KC [Paenibacillus sp. UNCCL117]|uniref:Ger(x)C family spore germination protein n=1 Tax=unclassified Paenibacillus TaxID=185978 RepID=UPI00087E05D7|nr:MULTISPECIES: Ger(x)C family spore germination protein [unclassified Paenibacillus]SDE30657.1 spore germination protein KC [Paenibacillus sp. cl123]SFW63044.1 spore germination protein KC [Paenibacillus sp. UNCCL117]
MAAFGRLILTGALLLLLTGCWDRTEINDLAFILSTAIDLEKDGSIRYSVMVPLPGSMGGASGGGGGTAGGDKSYYVDSEIGSTFREAQSKLQKRMARRMVLAHRRTVLVGEAAAREKGVLDIFDATPRSPESRMTTYFIITKGKAYEMLQTTPQFERFPSEAIRELAKSKMVIDMNLKDFALALSMPGGDPIAIHMGVKESEKGLKDSREVEVLGYSQFKRDKLVGTIEGRAAAGLTWLRAGSINIFAVLQMDRDQAINVRVFDTASTIKARLENGQLSFDIKVNTKAKVVESTRYYDFSQTDKINQVEKRLSAYIQESIQETLKRMLEKNTDSAQLGQYVWHAYPREWNEKYAKSWPQALKTAEFHIDVNSNLTETGLIYDNITKSEMKP